MSAARTAASLRSGPRASIFRLAERQSSRFAALAKIERRTVPVGPSCGPIAYLKLQAMSSRCVVTRLLLIRQRMAYPCHHAVPLAFFRDGIIDHHAVHGAVAAVAAVVPDPVLANAGHDKEIRCDPLVDDAGR